MYTYIWGSIPELGRSTGEGNSNPLQYSCLENAIEFLTGYSPWGPKESDTTEQLTLIRHISPPSWAYPPPPLHPTLKVITEQKAELPVLYRRFPLASYFTYGCVYMLIPLSQFVPLLPSPHRVNKTILYVYVSIPALQEDVVQIHDRILFSHKKKQNWIIYRDVDGYRVCHTKWSKSERVKWVLCINAYVESRKIVQMNIFEFHI